VRAPAFWRRDGILPALLAPFGALYGAVTTRRAARPGWRAPVPVICCGNASVGGAGKTTLALDLGARLAARGLAVAFLTRGYGGRESGRVRGDDAARFGDEALLLAAGAPTYAGADRAAGARLAVADGAQVLVMDDGLQNAGLTKTLSLLVIDGEQGFGNGRVIPAGPLRERVTAAAGRCGAAVLIGADSTGALAHLPPGLPVLHAALRARLGEMGPVGVAGPVLAFAGIGRPEKFAETLRAAGVAVAGLRGFPDHHRYSAAELRALCDEAAALGARLVTTPKDAVRLPAALRGEIGVVGVALEWADPPALEQLLARVTP
jgi:tetraacyldisaccharide 4'-kinase